MHIFYTYLLSDEYDALFKEHLHSFSAPYQQRIRQFKNRDDAQRSLLGRLMLYQAMQDIYNVDCLKTEVNYNAYGKPYFERKNVHFNISHSGGIIICALNSRAEVGIDIELMLPLDIEDFKRQMTTNEWQHIITATNSLTAFYDYWTQKEAVIKAQGRGLSTPLTLFEVRDKVTILAGQVFYLESLSIDSQYRCHIASTSQIKKYSLNKMTFQ